MNDKRRNFNIDEHLEGLAFPADKQAILGQVDDEESRKMLEGLPEKTYMTMDEVKDELGMKEEGMGGKAKDMAEMDEPDLI